MHQRVSIYLILFLHAIASTLGLNKTYAQAGSGTFLETLLKKKPQVFGEILKYRDSLKVQIIYTQITRDKNNKPSFTDYYFNVHQVPYFYPASTVKLPIAILALQKLHELDMPGLDRNSSMITESASLNQVSVLNDPSTADGRPSISQYIKKIFLVSDNDAFNRLYEFLGPTYINQQLVGMGYKDVQIRHRLEMMLTDEDNRQTNPILFFDEQGHLLYDQPMQVSQYAFQKRNDFVGNAYYQNGSLIHHPMDFSTKNRIGLEDLHNILRSVLFPDAVPKKQRFHLMEDDYRFLYQYLSQYPGESNYPSYDTLSNWDAYCKFLYWGADMGKLPANIRIFNKVGDAYGFLTDISYFVDFDRKIEFMLSCSIYCNGDGVLNDDKYDYEKLGYPFMKNLGRAIYDFEASRKNQFLPDLSRFKMEYDKKR
ncbi:MAG: serine hydrolase [Bacteroidetes bacterium]|nr:serine hydrolase [Bacteroidota bacterium]